MKERLPENFSSQMMQSKGQDHAKWQQRNRAWWESHPMRYDWNEPIQAPEFSRAFYEEIDRRFFSSTARYMPFRERPFDSIVPYAELPHWDVLEIGVGSGSHAHLFAPHCRTYTGVDITDWATRATKRRFEVFGLPGNIRRMDAEHLKFESNSFDFIWTWGVIHHSADTGRILQEMRRVLRPGGRATVMVYHRSFLYYYITTALIRGIIRGGFSKHSLDELLHLNTDGAIARFYLPREWRELIESKGFVLTSENVMGLKTEIFPFPAGGLKTFLINVTPDSVGRFVTNTCRQGSLLITTIKKP